MRGEFSRASGSGGGISGSGRTLAKKAREGKKG